MAQNRSKYIQEYKKARGLKRVVVEVPGEVKDEIAMLAAESGMSINEYVLSHLPLTTYHRESPKK